MRTLYLVIMPLLVSTEGIFASFSFKDIVTYVSPKKQEDVLTYEHKLENEGTLYAETTNGKISVKTWSHNKIVVEVVKKGSEKDLETANITTNFKDHEAYIQVKQKQKARCSIDINIIAPHATVMSLRSNNGSLHVTQPHGPVDASILNGAITILDSTSVVHATSENGAICIQQKQLSEPHTITAQTTNGAINLGLPLSTNAHLNAHTTNGIITSSLYITPESINTKLNRQYWDRVKHECIGAIGSGGSLIKLASTNGKITISDY
ncbi:DUF4097 family beta strand repeat protein [Candidatus Babeliales bacterium]|nr:DUF4097 family beta strand repeat protein [Candidatus Babeliales bacterium]